MESTLKERMDPCAGEERIFAAYPVPKVLLTMTLPTVISQIIYVIYNMADTWFAGLTGDANTVAAVSLCLPVYNLMTGLSNLFGISGASAMARALGEHDRDKTRHCCAVAIWSALGGAVVYAVLLALFQRPLLAVIGGAPSNLDYAVSYTTITMIVGAIPTILPSALAHLIRAAGTGAGGCRRSHRHRQHHLPGLLHPLPPPRLAPGGVRRPSQVAEGAGEHHGRGVPLRPVQLPDGGAELGLQQLPQRLRRRLWQLHRPERSRKRTED